MNPAVIVLGVACLILAAACAVLAFILVRRSGGDGIEDLEKRLELSEKSRADADSRLRSELTDLITRQNTGLTGSIDEKLNAVSRSVGEMRESSKTITESVTTQLPGAVSATMAESSAMSVLRLTSVPSAKTTAPRSPSQSKMTPRSAFAARTASRIESMAVSFSGLGI